VGGLISPSSRLLAASAYLSKESFNTKSWFRSEDTRLANQGVNMDQQHLLKDHNEHTTNQALPERLAGQSGPNVHMLGDRVWLGQSLISAGVSDKDVLPLAP
jgi:hypothetical protein